MSLSTYYRAQAQKCLSLSRACSDRSHATQLAFMANRYFERAEELEQDIRLERAPASSHDKAHRPRH
jgi:hypothetical protein